MAEDVLKVADPVVKEPKLPRTVVAEKTKRRVVSYAALSDDEMVDLLAGRGVKLRKKNPSRRDLVLAAMGSEPGTHFVELSEDLPPE